jgi:antirestriction protein ArdC
MTEYGYLGPSQEELVAEIGTRYFQTLVGITNSEVWNEEYVQAYKAKMKADRNFVFSASSFAQKAIDFILDENVEVEDSAVAE